MDMQTLSNMFVLAVPVLEKILRPIIVYVFLIVVLRLAGKRELAQLNPFDLVVLLTLSNTVQNAIIGNDNSVTGGLIGAATLLVVNYLVVRFLYSHRQLDEVVEGKADYIIINGKVNKAVMEREVITLAELESAARKQGYSSLDEIQEAVLEPGGSISFSAREPEPEIVRHKELISRIDSLSRELSGLRSELARKS
jgi:uncharacterized membrane protein YcaP (DUF421 family)